MPRNWLLAKLAGPAEEPVSVDEQKAHSRVTTSDTGQLGVLAQAIADAREQFETRTDRATTSQQWVARWGRMWDCLMIPKPPLISIDSVTYVDTAGVIQTVPPSTYKVYTGGTPGLMSRNASQAWPTDVSQEEPFPWEIIWTCGYASASMVPQAQKSAIMQLADFYYRNRASGVVGTTADELPHSFEAVVAQYQVFYHWEELAR